jgi:hypothetical protein
MPRRAVPRAAAAGGASGFGGAAGGGADNDEMIPLGTDELMDEDADLDLGGEDDDLEGI